MVLTDVLYDVVSGLLGIIMGALASFAINYRRNNRLMSQIQASQQELDQIRTENQHLLQIIEDKENQILIQEQAILKSKKKKK